MLDLASMQRSFRKIGNGMEKPAPKAPMPEKERLALREAAKSRLARLAGIEADRNAIEAEAASYDAEADRLAADHVESMAPLQAELRDLEEKRIQATIDRKPANAADEERRVVLIDTIAEANRSLEVALKAVRTKSAGIHERLMSTHAATNGSSVAVERRKLIELGNPSLLDELFIAQLTFEDAVRRCKRANTELREVSGDEVMTRRWNAELAAAGQARAEAEAEVERIREQIISE